MKWDKFKLSDICEVCGGTTPRTNRPEYWDGDITWLSPVDLPEVGSITNVYTSQRKITSIGVKESGLKTLPTGSLVFSTRASIGKIGIVQEPLTTNQGFTNLIPSERINVRYLAYVLKKNIPEIEQLGNTTTFKEVSRTAFKNFEIPLPPLHIQQQIADTLDKADALRRKDQELLNKYDELAQAIFYDMFGDPETNTKKWSYLPLQNITYKLGDGLHGTPVYDENGDYFFINGNNLIDGKIIITDNTKRVSYSEYLKYSKDLNKDTILVSINGTIGKIAFYNNEKIILGKSACYFNIDKTLVTHQYLYYLISSPYFTKYAMSEATGSTIKNVSLKTMRNFSVPLPPLELQHKFNSLVTKLKSGYDKQNTVLETSNQLYQSLQKSYF